MNYDTELYTEKLDKLKSNIVNWYDFEKHNSILELKYIDSSITELLCQKFNRVVTFETDDKKLTFLNDLAKRYNNLTIINSDNIDEKFDYILMIEPFIEMEDDSKFIKYLNLKEQNLNSDGKVLLVLKNKLGCKEIVSKNLEGITKSKIEDILIKSNYKFWNFYYLLPDLNCVNVIFSEAYLPTLNDIYSRNINLTLSPNDSSILENEFFSAVLKNSNKDFGIHANYFFIELGKAEIKSKLRAVFYNNTRLEKYRLRTKIYDKLAIKESVEGKEQNHIINMKSNIDLLEKLDIKKLDKYNETSIISEIAENGERLDKKIVDNFNNKVEVINLIDRYKKEILSKLKSADLKHNVFEKYDINVPIELLNTLNFVKYGLFDLTFNNIFLINNELYVYDQEWLEENVPMEFILYRAILYLRELSEEEKDEIYKEVNIYEFKGLFFLLELRIQNKIVDPYMQKLYTNSFYDEKEVTKKKLEDEYLFQYKLSRSKELINNDLQKSLQRVENFNTNLINSLNEQKAENAELKRKIEKNNMKYLSIYKYVKKPVKLTLKLCKKPVKYIYSKVPKNLKRKIKNKINYSRKLSKITGIPMYSQYNNNTRLFSKEDNTFKEVFSQFHLNKTIGIHLHLYYEDLLEEFYNYLSNIPYVFDLYVSVRMGVNTKKIRKKLEKITNLNKVEVCEAENCGRDFGPMFVLFAKKLIQYDYIMHIHSKKSLRMGQEQSEWRQYLLNNLLGSPEKIMKCFYLMENYNVGLVYPDAHYSLPFWAHAWLDEEPLAREMCKKLGIKFSNETFLEFSAGSMFWAKKDALKPILEFDLSWEDFGKDKKQVGGTLEYVFERIPGILTRKRGYDIAIYNENKNQFLLNTGIKNLNVYCTVNFDNTLQCLSGFDVITFDIFDTLITRKIFNPDDIFRLIEKKLKKENIIIEDFYLMRKTAESNVRIKKNFQGDCTIDEIYEEFCNVANISLEISNKIKDIEIQTEYEMCIPREDSLKLYNELLKIGKKIILISDMYLTKNIIERILHNCGYNNYFDILISSEIGVRKDNGTMWKYFFEKYGQYSTIHVGDNEESDLHKLVDLSRHSYYLMRGTKEFRISDYNINKSFNLHDSVMMGCIVNKILFNSPFKMYNSETQAIIKNEFEFGYSILGPIILKYLIWLINSIRISNKKEVILFASREGYYLQKIYEHIVKRLNVKEISNIEQHYLYISRRAISVAQIEKQEDVYEIMRKPFKGTLRSLFYYRLGIKEDIFKDRLIKLPDDFEIVKNIIDSNLDTIMQRVKYEKENYLYYINNLIENIDNKNLNLVDLGYSGTAQYYLSLLLNKKVAGKYFVVSNDIKPLKLDCKVDSCYNKNIFDKNEIENNVIFKFSLLLEAVVTAPQGQLKYFENDKNGVKPILGINEDDEKKKQLDLVYDGVLKLVDDVIDILNKDILNNEFDNEVIQKNYYNFLREVDKLDVNMKKLFDIDDDYCCDGIINGVNIFKYL